MSQPALFALPPARTTCSDPCNSDCRKLGAR
jgi:hypothetical protein